MNKINKLIIFTALVIFVFGMYYFADIYYFKINYSQLDNIQKYAAKSIVTSWQKEFEKMPKEKQKLITYEEFLNKLNFFEKRFAIRVFNIKPDTLGFMGPYFSKDPVKELATIPETIIKASSTEYKTGINFLPANVYSDFNKMNEQMKKDIGKKLIINSGYRGPGYQAYLFFYYLHTENWYSLYENAKWIAMPGYSEHNSPNTAIDFINEKGISGEEVGQTAQDFENLPEYSWLTKNAKKFNFYLSYPKDNSYGVAYEPWHWHWEKK